MKFGITVSQYSLMIILAIPITSPAQQIIDTSSPQDLLVEPTIVVRPSKVEPNCHTYTGCGVVVVKKYPKHHYKPKPHCVYYRPC